MEKVNTANISVRIHEDFMEAVKKNEEYCLHYTREETGQVIERMVNARELFHRITETNWIMQNRAHCSGTELPAGIYLAIQRNFLMQA